MKFACCSSSFLVLAALSAVAAQAPCDWSQAGMCQVPLANPKYQDHHIKIQKIAASNPALNSRRSLARRQIAVDALSGTGDSGGTLFAYHGTLQVGTPAQTFNILFDTGSQVLWLQSKTTKGGVNAAGNQFDATRSSTFKDTGIPADKITYVDGTEVTGTLATDNVSINNLTVENLTFEVATSITGNNTDMDGIMGMSFSLPAIAGSPNQPTFFERLVSDKKITSPVFGYYIDSSNTQGGISFGGIDQARVAGDFVTLPIAASGQNSQNQDVYLYWQSLLSSISFAGQSGSINLGNNFAVVFDTGTSLAVLPVLTAYQLNRALGMVKVSAPEGSADLYVMDCSDGKIPADLPNIDFKFGGQTITITPQEYIFFQQGSRRGQIACVSGFAGQDISSASTMTGASQALLPSAIFGNVFLRRFYTVFNIKDHVVQIAVANRGSNVTPSLAGAPAVKSSAIAQKTVAWTGILAAAVAVLAVVA